MAWHANPARARPVASLCPSSNTIVHFHNLKNNNVESQGVLWCPLVIEKGNYRDQLKHYLSESKQMIKRSKNCIKCFI